MTNDVAAIGGELLEGSGVEDEAVQDPPASGDALAPCVLASVREA